MANYPREKIRNVAIVGHSGEGKTSLTEAILYATGSIARLGRVDDGTTVSDYETEEINRKMSISLTPAYAHYKGFKINLLDTPGFFDFEGEMVSALTVADGAVIVTSASGVLSVGTEKAIEYCLEKRIPMIIFVNGVNRENSSYENTVKAIKAKYGDRTEPIEYPVMDGYRMMGYVNAATNEARDNAGNEIEIPAGMKDRVAERSAQLAETAALSDDALLEKFFDEGALTKGETMRGLRQRAAECEFVPMLAGAAAPDAAIGGLLDDIVELFPFPGEISNEEYRAEAGDPQLSYDESAPTVCRIFKTIVDPFVGKMNLFKAYAGQVRTGDALYNVNKESNEKINALYMLKGKTQEPTQCIPAGDIGALAKLTATSTGDTLSSVKTTAKFDPIEFPNPVYSLAILADERGAADKVVEGMRRLMEEDRTFRVEKAWGTNETVITAMGETQIDVVCKRVRNKYKIDAVLAEPRVAYRETIRKQVEQEGKCKKQTGGSGLYGQVFIRFEPAPDADFEFAEEVVGGAVPRQFFPSVEKGLIEAKANGVLAGFPLVGFRAVLYDGSSHPVDSKEQAFIEAAKIAYREGIPKAMPALLEPIMTMKITAPTEFMGDILGDITKRRGKVYGMETVKNATVIAGEAPAAEIRRYAIDLRSMTQGRGRFSVEFARYDEVPASLVDGIVEAEKKRRGK